MSETVVRFAPNQPLPEGWSVIQLDSGHYMATNGEQESAITVNRFHARQWAWEIAEKHRSAIERAGSMTEEER